MADKKRARRKKKSLKRFSVILVIELAVLVLLAGSYYIVSRNNKKNDNPDKITENSPNEDKNNDKNVNDNGGKKEEKLTPEQLEAQKEQERLQKEIEAREELIAEANKLTLSYDYDAAIELIKTYQGAEGGYQVYPALVKAIQDLETTKDSLLLYGGSYKSVTEFNHVFFHTLVADNSKAFDADYTSTGYNMYMTTIYEFNKMMQKMYEDGYVLVSIHDIAKPELQDDGTYKFKEQKIYLPEGKKPFVLSQDDVSYYEYMKPDGFASRLMIGDDGKVTCEMILDDGSAVQGDFDMVPILDKFVEEHPDFSYKGAKGIIALTGYEGVLGYRTNDLESPTYAQDVETAKEVAEAMKANGWEFASHSWGHRNSLEITTEHFKRDTQRWVDEVLHIIGPTDIYIFPKGVDFETTMGHYSSEKYKFAKEKGFNYFCGVDSKPWMHIKDDYVRMTRRPLDGQAMLQFPERLADLFNLDEIIDPERPPRDW